MSSGLSGMRIIIFELLLLWILHKHVILLEVLRLFHRFYFMLLEHIKLLRLLLKHILLHLFGLLRV